MLKKIELFLNKVNVSGKSLLVAFSGGYDSTVLLNSLLDLREGFDFKISAIHLNHNWRGDESFAEQKFCRDFCLKNNIDFYTKTLEQGSTSNELEAREERYNFFKEVYFQNNFDYLLTAHTKSDNAETLIFRLAKGTGINGLKGICDITKISEMNVLRPLMNITRCEIERYIKENNLDVNFDSSNLNKKYKRNKVRLDIIPHFKELSETFEDNILNTSKIAFFYDSAIDYFLKKEQVFVDKKIVTKKFLKMSYDVKNIILYKFLALQNIQITFKQIQLLLKEIEGEVFRSGKYFSISDERFILIKPDFIEFVERKDNRIDDYNFVISEVCENIRIFPNGVKNFIYVDKSVIKEPLVLRKRCEGDVFQPFGMQGKMKLKKFLNMKGVEKFQRDNLVLLTNADNQILWIYPLATSELCRVKETNFVKVEIIKNE